MIARDDRRARRSDLYPIAAELDRRGNALPAPDQHHRASREHADVAVERDGDVENRANTGATASAREAVPHNALDGRESSPPLVVSRARPHAPQLHCQLRPSAFSEAENLVRC